MASVLTGLQPASWSTEDAVRYETALEGAAQVIGFCAAADVRARGSWQRLQATWAVRRRALTPYAVDEVAAIYSDAEDLLAEALPPPQAQPAFDSDRVFRERIVPNELTGTPQRDPVVVMVSQPAVTALVRDLLDRRGQPVVISPDRYEPYHPDFWHPIDDEPRPAPDCSRWTDQAIEYARAQRFDVVLESSHEQVARDFKAAGYRVEVAIVATSDAAQRFGVLDRHLRALEAFGCGRLAEPITPEHHAVEQDADLIGVFRPNGELLYGNQRSPDGRWHRDPAAAEAIAAERDRQWSIVESRRFLEAVTAYERRGLSAPIPWVREKTVEGARAVLALAQPHLHPDAVAFHKATAGITD
ncbi:zeta toxin family protein [Kribbella lupini]|uniref:zeta toxin family protein n=1 Tax=Kribbella lupini TaxID=291602 RepID=UPI0031E0CBAC